jgi:Glycosyltransferase family 87
VVARGGARTLVVASSYWRRPALVASLLFVVACAAAYGGLFSHAYPGDTVTYAKYGRALVQDHRIPYRDFYDEYPPGSVPLFALPALLWDAHYVLVFKLLMTACGIGIVACATWVLARLELSYLRLAPLVLAPPLMGPVFLNRYDPLPALLASLALVAALGARARTTGALLGLGTVIKLYPAVAVPLAARRLALGRFGATFAVAGAILFLPFFAIAHGGVGFSLWTQAKRHLQIESLGSALLLALDKLHLYDAHWIAGKPGSIDLGGALADVVATLSSALAVGLVLLVARAYWRGRDDDARLVTAWAAAVTAFTVFGKVLSPQYLTWLVGIVPLAAGRRGLYAAGALLAALALTQPEYFLGDHGLREENWTVWLLLARNGLLAGAFALLYRELSASRGG